MSELDLNLDEWIAGIRATERTVVIYQRGDLVAKAEDLLRRYETAKKIPAEDRGINDDSPESLLAALEDCQRELTESMSVWTVRALSPTQVQEAHKAAKDAAGEGGAPDLTAYLIAAAVTSVRLGDGREAKKVTGAQVQAIRDNENAGPSQVMRLFNALNEAMNEEPNVQAPFSHKS